MTAKIRRDGTGAPVHYTTVVAGASSWECLCGFETAVWVDAVEHDNLGPIGREKEPPMLAALEAQLAEVVVKAQDEGHQAGMTFALLQMRDRASRLRAEADEIDSINDTGAWLAVTAAARALEDLATDLEEGL